MRVSPHFLIATINEACWIVAREAMISVLGRVAIPLDVADSPVKPVYRQEAESILRTAALYTDRCPTPYWTMKNGFVERILEPNDPCVLLCKLEAADCMKGVPRPASAAATKAEDTGSKARHITWHQNLRRRLCNRKV